MSQSVYTIGHSTHPPEHFLKLLWQHGITALCDVRSNPYSRINPQFNREELNRSLTDTGVAYVFLGKELGARSEDPSCYENGKVQYNRLAQTALFQDGIKRVFEGMKTYKIALCCAEREPLECHRTILVARELSALGLDVQHIHADGRLESHSEAIQRLADMFNLPQISLFHQPENIFDEAYRQQGERIAYSVVRSAARGAAK